MQWAVIHYVGTLKLFQTPIDSYRVLNPNFLHFTYHTATISTAIRPIRRNCGFGPSSGARGFQCTRARTQAGSSFTTADLVASAGPPTSPPLTAIRPLDLDFAIAERPQDRA